MFWNLVGTIVASHQQLSDTLQEKGATKLFRQSYLVEVDPPTLEKVLTEKSPDKMWLNPSDTGTCWKNANYDLPTGNVTFCAKFEAHK